LRYSISLTRKSDRQFCPVRDSDASSDVYIVSLWSVFLLHHKHSAIDLFFYMLINLQNQYWGMHAKYALIAALLVIGVLSAGCSAPFPAPTPKGPASLVEPSWHLVSYNDGNGSMVPVNPPQYVTLKFSEDGNVSGFIDGCWKYSGRYTTLGETIKVTNLTGIYDSTCPIPGESALMEDTYFALLQKSPRFNVNGDTLFFGYFDANRYLVFTRT
jgi:heat shock protein HslJ